MNIVDISIIAIVFLMTLWGFKKGLFVSLMGILKYVAGVPLSLYVSNTYYKTVYTNFAYSRLLEKVNEKIAGAASLDTFSSALKSDVAKLPDFLQKSIDLGALKGADDKQIASFIMDQIVQPLSYIAIKIILFIATFIIFALICSLISAIVKSGRKKDTFICRTNSVLGGVLGFVKSVLLIMVLSAVLYCTENQLELSSNNTFMHYVKDSALLNYINDFNPLNSIF